MLTCAAFIERMDLSFVSAGAVLDEAVIPDLVRIKGVPSICRGERPSSVRITDFGRDSFRTRSKA